MVWAGSARSGTGWATRWTFAWTAGAGFDLPSAQRIAKALEPYNIMYLEDAMLTNNPQAFAQLARETSVPICVSETFATRYEYREFFEPKACDVIMYDLTLVRRSLRGQEDLRHGRHVFHPDFAPYVRRAVTLYLFHSPLRGDLELLDHGEQLLEVHAPVPVFHQQCSGSRTEGHVRPPELPGIGAEIKPELFKNGDAIVETVAKV